MRGPDRAGLGLDRTMITGNYYGTHHGMDRR